VKELDSLEAVIAYLHQVANGGLKTAGSRETGGELKRGIREERGALREIARAS